MIDAPIDMVKSQERKCLTPDRQKQYAFLSTALAQPPSAEWLETIRSSDFPPADVGVFTEPIFDRSRCFTAGDTTASTLENDARQEFMNLFRVPGGQYVAPYESVYRDTRDIGGQKVKGLLMGRSAIDVRKWYRLAAIEPADDYNDLPDHICLELSYLEHLCGKEREFGSLGDSPKLTRAREMQRDFLAGHVVTWVPILRDKILEKSQNDYFRALGDVTVEFTQRDLATLEDFLGSSSASSVPEY